MRWVKHLEEGLIAFLMAAMTLVTFMQVVARYVFNYSFVWALELTGVMFAWLIFIGMSYGAAVLCIVYASIVFVGGFTYVRKMYEIGILMQDIPIQQWIPRVILPLGFALLAIRFAQVLYRLATGGEAHLLGDEAADALKLKQEQTEDSLALTFCEAEPMLRYVAIWNRWMAWRKSRARTR